MKTKFDKYWGECNLLMSIASVLDLRCKMRMVGFSFSIIYGEEAARSNVSIDRKALQQLYNDYKLLQSSRRHRESSESGSSTQELGAAAKYSKKDYMLSAWS